MTKSTLSRLGLRWFAPACGILALFAFSNYGAETVTLDRTIRDYKTPQEFEWKSAPGSASATATIFGDPSKPGLYMQLLKRPPDNWSQPHSHPNDRYITVLAGTFKVGAGSKLDKQNTVSLGPGSVVRDIANQTHYDGTGPEGVTLQITGMGPATLVRATNP